MDQHQYEIKASGSELAEQHSGARIIDTLATVFVGIVQSDLENDALALEILSTGVYAETPPA